MLCVHYCNYLDYFDGVFFNLSGSCSPHNQVIFVETDLHGKKLRSNGPAQLDRFR